VYLSQAARVGRVEVRVPCQSHNSVSNLQQDFSYGGEDPQSISLRMIG